MERISDKRMTALKTGSINETAAFSKLVFKPSLHDLLYVLLRIGPTL